MCDLLNEQIKNGGSSKRAQLKKWKRFFNYENKGNKFIITEIYDSEKPKAYRADDIYTEFIQIILHNQLIMADNNIIVRTKRQLFEMCGMVNNAFIDSMQKEIKLSKFFKSNDLSQKQLKWHMSEFNNRIVSRLNPILYNSLNRLQKNKYLEYFVVYTICQKDKNNKLEYHDATDIELSYYKAIEKEIKDEMNITRLNDWICEEYYKKINTRIYELFEWECYYKQIKIIMNKNNVLKYVENNNSNLKKQIKDNKINVNDRVVRLLNNVIEDTYNKNNKIVEDFKDSKEEVEWGIYDRNWVSDDEIKSCTGIKRVLKENYVLLQQQLVKMFINIDNIEFVKKVENNKTYSTENGYDEWRKFLDDEQIIDEP